MFNINIGVARILSSDIMKLVIIYKIYQMHN